MALPIRFLGTQLDGRYRLDRWIGEGASSWVFAAHDLRLDRPVAVKIWKPSVTSPGADRRRFVDESRMLARLTHPHVVAAYDAGESTDGTAYIVMELSDGGNLEAELERRGKLPADEAVALVLPLLGALACAHDLGIIHRDIKPANIVLTRQHGEFRAKLLDFGIARSIEGHSSGDTVGTPSYMAPEQARGDEVSPATDVWAMGVVLFRTLSGRLPFEASQTTVLLLKVVQERAPRFAEGCPALSPCLAHALDRALEPRASKRYPSMREFARALAQAVALDGRAVPAHPDPIGLPEFDRWMKHVSADQTRPLTPEELAVVAPLCVEAAAARRRHMRVLGAGTAFVLMAAATLTALSLPWRPEGVRNEGVNVAADGPAVTRDPAVPSTRQSAPSRATASASESKPEQERRSRLGALPKRKHAPMVLAPPAAVSQSDGGIVANWDW